MKKRIKSAALLKLSFVTLALFTGISFQSAGQTSIVINEVSQGTSGSQEYIEFLVTGPDLVNCNDIPPCIDLRLWVFDDNNGYLNGSPTTGVGIAAGACRFSNDPFWSCIPAGTMILIYNDNDLNPGIPAPDLSMADGNCALAIPISSNLFNKHTSLPSSSNSSYAATGWVSGGSWTNISMANGQDGFQIYDPANLASPVFSIGWGASNSLGDIYMGASSASGDVFYSTDCNYFNQVSWAQGSAGSDQTAGAPNTAAQSDCIGNMNANCNPPTVVIATTPTTCVGCDGTATATITGGTPPYVLTWTAAPGSGQGTVNATGLCAGGYTITLIDDNGTGCQLVTPATVVAGGLDPNPPTINCPGNLVATCSIMEQPSYVNLAAFQASDGTVSDAESGINLVSFVLFSEISDGNTCPELVTRTYQISDNCGNLNTCQQIISVDDNILPTATNPAPIVVECITDVPLADPLVVIDEADNCSVPTVFLVSDVSDGLSCPETITRTYSVTDACGNSINVIQTITVDDTTLPTASNPIDIFLAGGLGPAPDPFLVIDEADNCDPTPTVVWISDVTDGGICPETITRTYSVIDDCGNTINLVQLIVIGDAFPPTASNPAPIGVECSANIPLPDPLVVIDETDNTGVPIVTWLNDTSDGLSCPETITRTYSVTDDCGNVIFVTQIITVHDITPPTASNPAPVGVECSANISLPDPLVVTDEADNCSVPTVLFVSDVSDGNSCPETITRTYSITDACGNQTIVTQSIVVDDITPPTASNPLPISVPGQNDIPPVDVTVVFDEADNCTVSPNVIWVSDVSDGNLCNLEKIIRTFLVTDDCGNTTMVEQIITILAVPPPIDAGPDQTICTDDLVTIQEFNPSGATIIWSPALPSMPTAPAQTTTYSVIADNLGCISTDNVTIFVENIPAVSFFGDVLSGCEPLALIFTNTSTSPTSLVDCIWNIEGAAPINGCGIIGYTFDNAGTYDITFTTTSINGCTNSMTYTDYIYVEGAPLASFSGSTTEFSIINTDIEFTNNSVGASNYLWDFGDNSGTSSVVDPTHIYTDEELSGYIVELIAFTPLGCSDTTWIAINVTEEVIYYVPNTFTPDGDGYNQNFQAIFTSGYDPYDFSMLIFNRWGEVIWESHNDEVGWDGTYDGKLVQDGTYTWGIEFKTAETDERVMITGHVNVLR